MSSNSGTLRADMHFRRTGVFTNIARSPQSSPFSLNRIVENLSKYSRNQCELSNFNEKPPPTVQGSLSCLIISESQLEDRIESACKVEIIGCQDAGELL